MQWGRCEAQAAARAWCGGGGGYARRRRRAVARAVQRGLQRNGECWWRVAERRRGRRRVRAAARCSGGAGEADRAAAVRSWEKQERGRRLRARHIYDRWDPRFSLTPVDPTHRV